MHLTAIYVRALIQFEQSALSAYKTIASVYTNELLAVLQSILFTLLGVCTNVNESFANMIRENAQETMLLLRQSAQKVSAQKSSPSTGSVKVSIIQEMDPISQTSVAAEESAQPVFQKLSEELRIPSLYRVDYTSTALFLSLQPAATNTSNAFYSIVSKAITDLSTLSDTISTNKAARSTKLGSKTNVNVDGAIREDRSAVLTQSIINIAR